MSRLIDDLLSYSEVSLKPDKFELVDMNEVVALVVSDLDVDMNISHPSERQWNRV